MKFYDKRLEFELNLWAENEVALDVFFDLDVNPGHILKEKHLIIVRVIIDQLLLQVFLKRSITSGM